MMFLMMMKEKMMIYNQDEKPHFKEALDEANLILISSESITAFPFSLSEIIKEKGMVCRSFDKAVSYGVDIGNFGSEDALCVNYGEKYIIFYNNSNLIPKNRKRFSLGHELGHKVMNHDLGNNDKYSVYEIEANFFAAQLLMPEQIINELRKRGKQITRDNLQRWFQVSKAAADKRLETLNKIDYSNRNEEEKSIDNYIVLKFKAIIDSIAPVPNKYDEYDPHYEEELQNKRNSWY